MAQVLQRTDFNSAALVRLLARLTDAAVPESRRAFADRLSQWLGWTDAISLSAALDRSPVAAGAGAGAGARAGAAAATEERECTRVRSMLANAIADEDGAFSADTPSDFLPYRRRYLARQQAMEAAIAALRARLRTALAARSSDMGRLAAVDAVMEQALGAHEHDLLATAPVLLEKHFKRLLLREAEPEDATPGGARDCRARFAEDMQRVLLAELDIRFQPVEGLLEALRMR